MNVLALLATLVAWTGLVALVAEGLTRSGMQAFAAQAVWRGAALLMVLPILGWTAGAIWPAARFDLPGNLPWPDLAEGFGTGAAGEIDIMTACPPGCGTGEPIAAIIAILVAGWLIRFASAILAHARLRGLTGHAEPVVSGAILAQLEQAARQAGLKRTPRLAIHDMAPSPFICRTGRDVPMLCLPANLTDRPGLALILLHECVHVARRDLVWRPFERAVADLVWFSPFAWLARSRLDLWREAACDAQTAALSGDTRAYARTLADTARLCRPARSLPVAALIFTRRRTLPMRINALLSPAPASRSHRRLVAGAVLAALAAPLVLAQGLASAGPGEPGTEFTATVIDHPHAKVTSRFGMRTHPVSGEERLHRGTDIAAPFGTPVRVPAAGTVTETGARGAYGNIVEVRLDGGTHRLRFAQLQSVTVTDGERLSAGDVVGTVGASGVATGPHLHIEYLADNNGEATDPQSIVGLDLLPAD